MAMKEFTHSHTWQPDEVATRGRTPWGSDISMQKQWSESDRWKHARHIDASVAGQVLGLLQLVAQRPAHRLCLFWSVKNFMKTFWFFDH